MAVTKYVLPVVVGAMSGMILMTLGKNVVYVKYPPPAGTDFYDADSLAKYMQQLPAAAFVLFLVDYIICSFLAGIITTLTAKRETAIPAIAACLPRRRDACVRREFRLSVRALALRSLVWN